MDSKQHILLSCVATVAYITIIRRKWRREENQRRRKWVKDGVSKRASLGAYHALLMELKENDVGQLKIFLRMAMGSFLELLSKVEQKIIKEDTNSAAISFIAAILLFLSFYSFIYIYCKGMTGLRILQ